MKTLKFLIASSAAAVLAGSAFAAKTSPQEIYITGSTAFRAAAVVGIVDSLQSGTAVGAFPTGGSIGGSQAIIGGKLKSNGDQVYYVLAWAGSIGGLQAAGIPLTTIPAPTSSGAPGNAFPAASTWMAPSNLSGAAAVTVSTASGIPVASGGSAVASPAFDTAGVADATFSDSFQGSTNSASDNLAGFDGGDGEVGIIPFVWVKGPCGAGVSQAAWGRFTNMSQGAAIALITSGKISLNHFTGNSADSTIDVILTGRNFDSGTRFACMAESQFGEVSSPVQAQFTADGTNSFIDSVGTNFAGPGGQTSGGNVTVTLKLPPDANAQGSGSHEHRGFIAVSYLGISDAKTVVTYAGNGVLNSTNNGGGTFSGSTFVPGATLSYSGVAAPLLIGGVFDIALTQLGPEIETGSYTFWEYEHLYYNTNTVAGGVADVLQGITDLANDITSTDATGAGLLLGSMTAARVDEFSPVF